jgi:hypothetical protein
VERFVLWALILSLEHLELCQALMNHLLLLEVKPPKWLDIAIELLSVWWDPTCSWPCEQLKLSQRRRRNHRVGDSELRSTNHCVPLSLLSALPSSFIVFQHYILWCALLLCRYYVYPSLNISRSSLHIFCELDCLLREISLNLLIPVIPVWYTGQTGLDWLIIFKVCKFQILPIHPPSRQFSIGIRA